MRRHISIPPKFYDAESINKIADMLGIKQKSTRAELEKVLEQAAHYFFINHDRQNRLNKSATSKKFRQLVSNIKKIRKLYKEVTQDSLTGTSDLSSGLYAVSKENRYRETLMGIYHAHEYYTTDENLDILLECLQFGFENAAKNKRSKAELGPKWDKTEQVLSWLFRILLFWQEHSKVPISEGKHTTLDAESEDEKVAKSGNISPAVKIITLMAAPLNKHLKGWKITNSKITQAIRQSRDERSIWKVEYLTDEEADELFEL